MHRATNLLILIALTSGVTPACADDGTHRSFQVDEVPTYPTLEDNAKRLFVHLLSSTEHGRLCGGLKNIDTQILHTTPGDIYVFSLENTAKAHVDKVCPEAVSSGNVTFEALGEGWSTPPEAVNSSLWHFKEFHEDYRRMGHWRLTFPIALAYTFGYKWVLQIDTDSNVKRQLQQNLVAELESLSIDMAGRNLASSKGEPTWGLPELTRYFLVAEQIVPKTLFDHCTPHNIDGLYTLSSESFPGELSREPAQHVEEGGGWDRTIIYGNFVVIRTNFWFRHDVQNYLALVLRTGGHFRFRWNEQSVMAMIWQIFVHPDNFHLFTFEYEHGG